MSERKKINLEEVLDACAKAKRISNDLEDETKKMSQLLNMQAIESNAKYLEELAQEHKNVQRDIETCVEYIKDVFKAVQKDAELLVQNASSLKTTMN
jgi:hypothetical protein